MENAPAFNVYTTVFNAVVFRRATQDGELYRLRLIHDHGEFDAWSWIPIPLASDKRIYKANITALPLDTDQGSTYVVTRIDPAPELDVFSLIPDDFGHSEGIVYRLRDTVDAVQSVPLRRFLSEVFSIPQVYRYFWTSPASQSHHHAYPGGLAEHSVEIAENVRDTPRLTTLERDIGIVHALAHDLGKLWCYDVDKRHLMPLGHELVGLHHLHEPLDRLSQEWPDGAVALQSLLAGQWKRSGKPILAVGKLVQAYDQASAERELRAREGHRFQPWKPTSWDVGNVLAFPKKAATSA